MLIEWRTTENDTGSRNTYPRRRSAHVRNSQGCSNDITMTLILRRAVYSLFAGYCPFVVKVSCLWFIHSTTLHCIYSTSTNILCILIRSTVTLRWTRSGAHHSWTSWRKNPNPIWHILNIRSQIYASPYRWTSALYELPNFLGLSIWYPVEMKLGQHTRCRGRKWTLYISEHLHIIDVKHIAPVHRAKWIKRNSNTKPIGSIFHPYGRWLISLSSNVNKGRTCDGLLQYNIYVAGQIFACMSGATRRHNIRKYYARQRI